MTTADESGFLSRWSRRKAARRQGQELSEPLPAATVPAVGQLPKATGDQAPAAMPVAPSAAGAPPTGQAPEAAPAAPPPPTLADVAQLTRDSDFRRFVAPGVDGEVRNAAMKKLFTDPHFNVMDGLDIYIDDYGRPDPLPAGMLRKMAQNAFVGLLGDDAASVAASPAPVVAAGPSGAPRSDPSSGSAIPLEPDENPDLRLQPDDAAGPEGDRPGAGEDAGRQR